MKVMGLEVGSRTGPWAGQTLGLPEEAVKPPSKRPLLTFRWPWQGRSDRRLGTLGWGKMERQTTRGQNGQALMPEGHSTQRTEGYGLDPWSGWTQA